MADYNSMKVPELKKLLQTRSLSVTGNKADLVARLAENDKQNAPTAAEPAAAAPVAAEANDAEITWSEDEEEPAKPAAVKAAAPAPAAAPAAATTETVPAPAAETATAAPAVSAEAPATETAAPAEPEAPKENFALNLNATDASEETKKRAERAKRFGITADDSADTEAKKKAERAARFGADSNDIASSLDAALPERRLMRGRGEGDQQQGGRTPRRQNAANGDRRGLTIRGLLRMRDWTVCTLCGILRDAQRPRMESVLAQPDACRKRQ
ncbi:predicted protein [Verticillium alfalfae VaMs.102]|uniref:Predicted protein n=1 Tax=Verticillium alfalfae (strain VaMs.102 / ATCC MYA-4576 / FGSC 10136) TaxID=526221 RepID=C9SXB8_VERA1|nr:predicted protein [Verticillium alfalfae VaMs.102]EEY23308.1 predicted protein [Verticillium alfalfae VaMs.102]